MADRLRGHDETIAQRLERDLAAFQRPLAPAYDACEKVATRVSSLSLVRYRLNDYSVPTTYGHRDVLVRGYVDDVVISCGAEVIARHPRSYERHDFIFDPLHYLALIEQKINALDQAAPLAGWRLPEEFMALRRLLEARMGKAGQARVRAGSAVDGSVPSRRRRCRSARRHRARSNRLRRREAPDPVPHRTAKATHLCKRGVPWGPSRERMKSGLGLNGHRPTISSLALGRYIACRKRLRHPSDRAGCPNLEMRRSLMPGHAAIDCINHTLAKVGRERFRHVGRPPSPADTMNQKPPNSGILKVILSGREML